MTVFPIETDESTFTAWSKVYADNGPWHDWRLYKLAVEAEEAMLVRDFEQLQALPYLRNFTPLPHQTETARKVLHELHGRAILADEVGLGKTIEAGLILKEYMMRGLVKKALILVPASLVLQWSRELSQKFGIRAVAHKKQYVWDHCDCVVASIETAKRAPHREIVLKHHYDMLIVDEAHKLKNKNTSNYRFISELSKTYCLLLTATPVQNRLDELYHLVNILKPGQLGAQQQFRASHVSGSRTAKNEDLLREQLCRVMIRNRRADGDLHLTKRIVEKVDLQLSPQEMALYRGVSEFVRERYHAQTADAGGLFSLMTLQREVCSSRDAVFLTLTNMFKKTPEQSPMRARIWELVELIRQIEANTKAERALQIVREVGEKVIIFTEYRATQEYLLHFCKVHKVPAVAYRGGMNRGKKDWMTDLFRDRAQVLIATEAGGEGINLQFCHHMINYDLPWNPMRVEQRIGRIHRLGQTHDVRIYNFATRDTIEQHIVSLLHDKIKMFESVIGELDPILSDGAAERRFELSLLDTLMTDTEEQWTCDEQR
jgi:SNF2 family DNA or RNA helicase